MHQSVHIIVDDRERAAPVLPVLRELADVTVAVQHLKLGDYRVNDWLFERKTLLDFVESIIDGRLFSQAHRLLGSGQPAAIILEGRASDLTGTQMSRAAMQGALVTLSLVFQIPVLRARDAVETAHLLRYAATQLRAVQTEGLVRRARRPKQPRKQQLYVLQGFPGLGVQKASQMLDSFGSLAACLAASATELQRVPGIGPKIARAMRDLLDAPANPSGDGRSSGLHGPPPPATP